MDCFAALAMTIPRKISHSMISKCLELGNRFFLLTAALLAPWIALTALPPFRFGIWIDVESTLVAYHWIAGIFAVGLLLKSLSGPKLVFNPVIVGLISLLGVSLLITPIVFDSSLTWYGLPDSGQGILSFMGFIFILLGFKHLLDQGYGHFLWVNTLLATVIIAGFTLVGNIWGGNTYLADWSPYVFSAFLAFMSLGMLALSLTSNSRICKYSGVILCGLLIALSSNKTAISALGVLLVILASRKIFKISRFNLSTIVGLTPLIMLFSMIALSSFTLFPSLVSRVRIAQMVSLEMVEHPWRLLTGYGWGSYLDAFLANLTRVPEAMFQEGIWNPTWDALIYMNSHSHHQVVEALLATGILGALIVLCLPAVAVYISDRDKVMSAFSVFFLYAAMSSTWFEIPATLPFLALAYAAFWPKQSATTRTISSMYAVPLFVFGSICCISGGIKVLNTGTSYDTPSSLTCRQALTFPGPGEVHLARNLRSLINESKATHYASKNHIRELSQLVCAATKVKKPSLFLMVSLITLIGDLAYLESNDQIQALRTELMPKWGAFLEAFLARAPYRTDLLAPYFRWQIKQGNEDQVWNWCLQILAKNPKDPTALWFKGMLLKHIGHASAHTYLLNSLNLGVDRILPIDPKLVRGIKEGRY